MSRATLVIMAAGIGSRFGGGIKQLAPVGPNGEIIMDYSIYDAIEAGFDKVVFVIRKDLEKDFKEVIGNRIEKQVEVAYAYQEIDDIPENNVKRGQLHFMLNKPWNQQEYEELTKDNWIFKLSYKTIWKERYNGQPTFYAKLMKDKTAR